MKTSPKTSIKFLLVWLFFSGTNILCIAGTDDVPGIVPPRMEQEKAGRFSSEVKHFEALLNEGKLWEFYAELYKTYNQRCEFCAEKDIRKWSDYNGEAIRVANEWIFFFVAKAPHLGADEAIQKGFPPKTIDDISFKRYALRLFLTDENYIGECFIMFSGENEWARYAHMENAVSLVKWFHLSATKNREELRKFNADESQKAKVANISKDDALKQLKDPQSPISVFLAKKRRLERSAASLEIDDEIVPLLLTRIIEFFPRNGSMVRKYIKKAGFSLNPQFLQFKLSEDEVCFYLLDKYFPKPKKPPTSTRDSLPTLR
ncbi:MAG: hypothetical protein LBR07_08905 [Puniceicoccales bacterium]|jgi:hypothetical protein|nr:hypothetical protein [Puniceicoccales bacterium]